jgi:Ca2+-binding EF-hand superfamily protein
MVDGVQARGVSFADMTRKVRHVLDVNHDGKVNIDAEGTWYQGNQEVPKTIDTTSFLGSLDRDADGTVTTGEIKDWTKEFDIDESNNLSPTEQVLLQSELQTWLLFESIAAADARRGPSIRDHAHSVMMQLDTNVDNRIKVKGELGPQPLAKIRKMDRSGDGFVSATELRAHYRSFDTNGNGYLSPGELTL